MVDLKFKKNTKTNKAIIVGFEIFFIVAALIHVFPLLWAFNNSLKSQASFIENSLAITHEWRFDHFIDVFTDFYVTSPGYDVFYPEMLFNSLWILVVSVFVNVLSSTLLAYALAKGNFPGRMMVYAVVIFANTVPIIGAGPATLKLFSAFNMINNPFLMWLSWAGGFDFAFIVLYGAFKGVSPSYSESARIDGASEFKILFKVVLPQVFPCIVAIAVTQAIGVWNNYGMVMLYMRDYPNLAYGMYLFATSSAWDIADPRPIYLAATIISSIPVVVLYACTQKLILTNLTAGGLKG